MTLKFPDVGEEIALKLLLNAGESLSDVQLRLYVNDHTPQEDDTLVNYTEATFPGYAAKQLFGTSWVLTQGNPSDAEYPTQEFVCSVDTTLQTVYGYYITRLFTGDLFWAERFDAPVPVQAVGNRVVITPRLELYDTSDT